jgi:putative addiction module killer protein
VEASRPGIAEDCVFSPAGDGVSELRTDYGRGYRVYDVRHGTTLIILLCGGDKSRQAKVIFLAVTMSKAV